MSFARLVFGLLLAAGAMLLTASPTLAPPASAAAVADERDILVMLRLSPDHYRPNAGYGGEYGDRATAKARQRVARGVARRNGLVLVEEGWPMPLLGIDCYVMRVPEGIDIDAAIEQVARDPRVAWSQRLQVYETLGAAPAQEKDPLYRVQPAASAWRLAELHRFTTGRGVTVAVVDSRVELSHPDLSGQFASSRDFVVGRPGPPERHGTGVAGVISAKAGNGIGIAGVAPGARLMALRACWQRGAAPGPTVCDTLSLAKALDFAIQRGADVINLSLSGPPDRLLKALLAQAAGRDISVVAAFNPGLPGGGFPASEPGVIAVANESLASLPSGVYGAPGEDVPTTQPGGKWYLVTGSSFAAAHVSGLIALVREEHGTSSRSALVAARPTGGTVDACATVLRVSPHCDCSCAVASNRGSARR